MAMFHSYVKLPEGILWATKSILKTNAVTLVFFWSRVSLGEHFYNVASHWIKVLQQLGWRTVTSGVPWPRRSSILDQSFFRWSLWLSENGDYPSLWTFKNREMMIRHGILGYSIFRQTDMQVPKKMGVLPRKMGVEHGRMGLNGMI